MTQFILSLDGWWSNRKQVEERHLLRAFVWPAECYTEIVEATLPRFGRPGTLHMTLDCACVGDFGPKRNPAALRQYWRRAFARLIRWLDAQASDAVSRAATSGLRVALLVEIWSGYGKAAVGLSASVLTAAARLRFPIRVVYHIGDDD